MVPIKVSIPPNTAAAKPLSSGASIILRSREVLVPGTKSERTER